MKEYITYAGALLLGLFFALDLFVFHQLDKQVDLAGVYTAGGVFLGRAAYTAGVNVIPNSSVKSPAEPPLPPAPPL